MLDSSDEESGGFKINEAYASKYNEWRRREELQKRKLAQWIENCSQNIAAICQKPSSKNLSKF